MFRRDRAFLMARGSTERGCRRMTAVPTMAVALGAVLGMLLAAGPVWAGVGLGLAPTYPGTVVVGDTNLPVSLFIQNVSTDPQDAGTVTLDNIFHTPSCGASPVGSQNPCGAANADPGVFLVKGPVTGHTGTACAGKTFTIGPADPTTGEVEFIAQGGSVVLQASSIGGGLATCQIDFLVDVIKLPTKDAGAAPLAQTGVLGRVNATASVGPTAGTGTGSTTVTVQAPTPTPTATPTVTSTPTPTATPTRTNTPTSTPTPTPTNTPTATPSRTPTPSPTQTQPPTPTPPPIPVVPSPTSPAGIILIVGLSISIGWMLRRVGRAAKSR
jgi:hypothetical protein